MRRIVFVILSAVSKVAFAAQPQQLVCYSDMYQLDCPTETTCPPAPVITMQPIGQVALAITSQPDSIQGNGAVPVNLKTFGTYFVINADGRFSRNLDGSNYSPAVDIDLTDVRTGWTSSNVSTEARSSAQLTMSRENHLPGGALRKTHVDILCNLQ